MRNNFSKNFDKEILVTSGVIFICLLLYITFPASNVFQKIISSLTFLLVIPLLYVKIILKKNVKDFGLTLGSWKTGLVWSIISLVISISVVYILFKYFGLSEKYSLPAYISQNFLLFLAYEIFIVGFFTVLYEIFFRGFLMFSFLGKIGAWSIFLQASVFLLLFFIAGGIYWSLAPYIIFLLLSGIIAYFSRSIIYSFVASMIFNIIIDSFFIYINK